MQNSLDRLFEGMENTLRNVVAPTITDSYILSQVNSVAEIIGNLASRVEWNSTQLLEISDRVRPVLEAASGELPLTAAVLAGPAAAADWANADLLRARDEHLAALREVQRSLETAPDDDVESSIREFLAWHVDFESSLLRTASSRKKK
jgi:hypothetical protein